MLCLHLLHRHAFRCTLKDCLLKSRVFLSDLLTHCLSQEVRNTRPTLPANIPLCSSRQSTRCATTGAENAAQDRTDGGLDPRSSERGTLHLIAFSNRTYGDAYEHQKAARDPALFFQAVTSDDRVPSRRVAESVRGSPSMPTEFFLGNATKRCIFCDIAARCYPSGGSGT